MLRDGAEVGRVSEHTGSVCTAWPRAARPFFLVVKTAASTCITEQTSNSFSSLNLVPLCAPSWPRTTGRSTSALSARVWQIPGWQSAADTSGSRALATGHFDGELQALDSHPRDPSVFVTAGEDNRISVWDAARRRPLSSWAITTRRSKRVKRRGAAATSSQASFRCARAVCYSSDGSLIAVGTASGDLRVFDAASQEEQDILI